MKILITGMTSPQSSKRLNEKSLSFSGCISTIAESYGHTVEWVTPSVRMKKADLDNYDLVFAGIAPLLSVTSNKAYGVLRLVDELKGDDRLKFFIDTPEPSRITMNLRAVQKDPSRLTAPFHRLRKQYSDVVSDADVRNSVLSGVDYMADGKWPETFYPEMIWSREGDVADQLPNGAMNSVTGVNVDPFLVNDSFTRAESTKYKRWAVDTDKTKWSASAISSMCLPYSLMRQNKGATDENAYDVISSSSASLLSPTGDGRLWWSFRWAQSLNAGTPIVSDWRITSRLGESWSHLAAGIETMSRIDLYEIAMTQKAEYLDSLPSKDNVKERLGV